MIAAILLCGLGYAEGAVLSRRLGGWQVISWALLLSLPVMASIAALTLPRAWESIGMPAWVGLGYVSIFSMMVGFIFWYRGLALGGIAAVGQLQLLQPFFGFVLAAIFLGEAIAATMIISPVVVVLCVAGAKRFSDSYIDRLRSTWTNAPEDVCQKVGRNTLFHLPYSAGRCRHCAPVRAIHIMPSKNGWLSPTSRLPRPRSHAKFVYKV